LKKIAKEGQLAYFHFRTSFEQDLIKSSISFDEKQKKKGST